MINDHMIYQTHLIHFQKTYYGVFSSICMYVVYGIKINKTKSQNLSLVI